MIRRCLFLLPLLCSVAAYAQTPAFSPDFSKPEALSFAAPYAQAGGVASPVRVERSGKTLKMTATAGGSFGVRFAVPPFDLDQLTRLSFDYTATPDAKINLFFRVNGRYFAVIFTGPKNVRAGTTVVYDANVSKASGHVEIPLRAAIRSQMPTDGNLRLDEMLAGNWDNEGYLLAGIGGNGPGASWTISNFKLERPDVKPTFGEAHFEGEELVVPAQNLDALSFKNFSWKTRFGETPALYNPLRGAFVFDASAPFANASTTPAPVALTDGQNFDFALRGEGGAALIEGKATFRASSAPQPSPPRLMLLDPTTSVAPVDFETPDVPVGMNKTPNTVFERDQTSAYSGKWSARLTNPRTASSFDLPAADGAIDVAANPVLTFAYRCDDRLRVDLNLMWNNQPYSLHFADSDNPNPRLGDFQIVRDGQWHLAQFNLLDAMKKAQPAATEWKINNLMWNDAGWPGNVKGLKWWLDELKWAPKTNGKVEGQVALRDATGTQAISYSLDQSATTPADDKAEGGPKLSVDLTGKTGLWWLHVRAQNGAGKWSDTAHYPLWCG